MTRRLAIGVDLGGTNTRVGLGDDEGHLEARRSEKTEKKMGPEGISKQIIRMIKKVLTKKPTIEEICGIGIGSTGPLDLKRGGLMKPTNIPFDFVPLVEPLEEEFNLPVYLLNDCVAAAVGERYFGAGKGYENMVYVTLSTGIGGGIYVDDHLLIGKDGNAHEIGHFTIDFEERLLCACGKRGHWEAYCSGRGIPNYVRFLIGKEKDEAKASFLMRETGGDLGKLTAKILYNSAKAGDPLSREFVEKIGVLNAIGFACVVDAYDPSLITVGGSITLRNTRLVVDPIRRHLEEHVRNRAPKIIVTPLRDDIVLYGALATVFHQSK